MSLPDLRSLLLIPSVLAAAATAQPPADEPPGVCATLEDCIERIRDPRRRILHIDSQMDERIVDFGDGRER